MKKILLFAVLVPLLTGCIEFKVVGKLDVNSPDFVLKATNGKDYNIHSGRFSIYGKYKEKSNKGYLELKSGGKKFKFPFKLDEGESYHHSLINLHITSEESGQPFDLVLDYDYYYIDSYYDSEFRSCSYSCRSGDDDHHHICHGHHWVHYRVDMYQEDSEGQFLNADGKEVASFQTRNHYHSRHETHASHCH